MESPIDERYRLMLLEGQLRNPKESRSLDGHSKWMFSCPFCGPLGKTDAKRNQRKAALLWNATQHSWVFYCSKKGCLKCMSGMTFSNFLSALHPALGEAYRQERWHSGTTGKGHNCRAPERLIGIGQSTSQGSIKSSSAPDTSTGGDACLCFVPCAGQCGRHRQHCVSPETAAICRTGLATE